jgi:hypothetical protein
MSEPHGPLENRLSEIERALAAFDRRLRTLEHAAPALATPMITAPAQPSPDRSRMDGTDVVGVLTLIGRTFVLLAGAYLLRALSEAALFDRKTGAVLAMTYAMALTVAAYRVAPRNALSATFFGACTLLIGLPLLLEATTRFALLTPAAGAIALTATTGAVLAAAWRRDLRILAWGATLGGCGMAATLLVVTGAAVPFTTFLIVLGIATLWLGYDREWTMLRWVVAILADLMALALVGRALATPPRDTPSMVIAVQLFLLVGYLASIAMRTLVRGRDVLPFEAVQTGAMLVTALIGAVVIAHQTGTGASALGATLLAVAAGCYLVAFAPHWQVRRANYYFYTTLALVFALTGGELLLDGTALALLWASLAVGAAGIARRFGRTTMAVHAVVYLTVGAIWSGLVTASVTGLVAPVDAVWTAMPGAAWAVLAVIVVCLMLLTPLSVGLSNRVARGTRLALASLVIVTAAGAFVTVLTLRLDPGAPLYEGLVATLRTGIFAATALVVAVLGRRQPSAEYGMLLYPILGFGALKLLLEDIRTSPPSLLVVAFGLYGGALILGPRLARTRAPGTIP